MKIKLKGYTSSGPARDSPASASVPPAEASGVPSTSNIAADNAPTGSTHSSNASPSAHIATNGCSVAPDDRQAAKQEQQDNEDDSYQQDDSSSEASSELDESYVNAPLPLPDSSGDEYTAPGFTAGSRPRGRPRKQFANTSPRPRRESGRQSRTPVEPDSSRSTPALQTRSTSEGISRRARSTKNGKLSISIRARASAQEDEDDKEDEDSKADISGYGGEEDEDNDAASSSRGTPGVSRSASMQPSSTSTPAGERKKSQPRRGGANAASASKTKTSKGQSYPLAGEELALPVDPKGEEKVDADGQLLGGREYKCVTFKSPGRPNPNRLYILAIDAARCAGFRDSLYFFRRNPWVHKLNCTQDEKELLIAKGRLHVNLKSRQVTIVTARNCYKVFGARFVKNGRNVTDDYYEQAALARGAIPGSPAYSEVYDPEIDNTTLAMPKIGNFSKALGQGRPAYMKMSKAFEMANAPVGAFNLNPEQSTTTFETERTDERDAGYVNKDKNKNGGVLGTGTTGDTSQQRSMAILSIPQTYVPAGFGLVGGQNVPQFGANGVAPFGESWERSKAKKPAPHLNGRNWMLEFGKVTSEYNYAINAVRKEYNAWHKISLGNSPRVIGKKNALDNDEPEDIIDDEELEGMWPLSGDEEEYETLEEFRKREGIKAPGDVEAAAPVPSGQESEPDDRKRGRSPSPVKLANGSVKPEEGDVAMKWEAAAESEQPPKRLRRRRSPLRGAYDPHTSVPFVRIDTQPTRVIEFQKLNNLPVVDGVTDMPFMESARSKGLATVAYALAQ